MTKIVSGARCPAAAPLWRGEQVSGREKRQGNGALHDASRQTREIEGHRGKSSFIALISCLGSCYFSKESCIIVFNRSKNKESFFPAGRAGIPACGIWRLSSRQILRAYLTRIRPIPTNSNHFAWVRPPSCSVMRPRMTGRASTCRQLILPINPSFFNRS